MKRPVKDGQIVSVSLSWHSHDETGIDAARKQAAFARERLDASLAEVTALRAENERLRSRAEELSGMVASQEANIKSLRNAGNAEKAARVAAEDEFKAQLQAQKGEIARLPRMITARVDLKNVGAEGNSLNVLDVSDLSASVESPAWFRDAAGAGRVVKSNAGSLSFRLRCGGNGELQLRLRGQDVKGVDGKRVPVWIDYTSLVVDGISVLGRTKAVWHDKPFRYRRPVKDGQIVSVSLSWHSHDEVQALRSSIVWKAGRAVTWLPRKIKALLGRG